MMMVESLQEIMANWILCVNSLLFWITKLTDRVHMTIGLSMSFYPDLTSISIWFHSNFIHVKLDKNWINWVFLKIWIKSRQEPDCSLSYSGFFHMYDLGVSYTFHFHKIYMESSVIFLRNDVLILNGKENKEASTICFEIRIPKKNNQKLLRKVPSKI